MGKRDVYDISVKDAEHYVLENGVVTHNTGGMYSSSNVFMLGRAQDKDGTELQGYKFTINIEKSRQVREKSKFPLLVSFEKGISKYSGLLDLAIELDFVVKPKMGWYSRVLVDEKTGEIAEDKNWRAKDTQCEEFWGPLLNSAAFEKACNDRYQLGNTNSEEDTVDLGELNDE